VSHRSRGFGVEAGQVQQVAKQWDGEGLDIIALKDNAVTNVSEQHVGRAFGAIAAPYRQAFDQFGKNLAKFGDHTIKVSMRLGDVAAAYQRMEDANARRHRGVY
jgi:hypothetical protein